MRHYVLSLRVSAPQNSVLHITVHGTVLYHGNRKESLEPLAGT